jgi:hypothetical protein
VRLYGAKADGGVTDNTAAIQASVIDRKYTYVPGAEGYYKTSGPIRIPDGHVIYGDGPSSHIKLLWTAPPSGWTGDYWMSRNVFYLGNVGSEVDMDDPVILQSPYLHMTWHPIWTEAVRGATEIQLDTSAFRPGDLIFIQSWAKFYSPTEGPGIVTFYPPKYTQMNQVVSITDSFMTLLYPLDYTFILGSSVATEREPFTGSDGLPTNFPKNVAIRDMTIENNVAPNEGGGYCIFASAWNCTFENLVLKTHSGQAFGANCLSRSTLKNITTSMDQVVPNNLAIEIATMSDHVNLENINVDRGAIALNESGGFITLNGFDIGHGVVGTYHKQSTVVENGVIHSLDGNTNAWTAALDNNIETEYQVFDNVTVGGLSHAAALVIGPTTKGHIAKNCILVGSGELNWPTVKIYNDARSWKIDENNIIIGKIQIDT